MSLAAIADILIFLALYGIVRQQDEGTAAHLFQLLMVLQVPVIIYFGIRYVPQFPKQAVLILLLQICAAVAAFAPIYILDF